MSTIPPSASLNLPPVTMSGKYVMEEHDTYSDQIWSIDELPAKQGYYLQGNYLRCVAEVGLEGTFANLFPLLQFCLCIFTFLYQSASSRTLRFTGWIQIVKN